MNRVKIKYTYCTNCGKKIGWFRKIVAWCIDKNPHQSYASLSQFCCTSCSVEGIARMINILEEK